jgi:hypothetical protein
MLIAIECVHKLILDIFHAPRHLVLIVMMAYASMKEELINELQTWVRTLGVIIAHVFLLDHLLKL